MHIKYTFILFILISGQFLSIWIVGHLFIFCTKRRALQRICTESLNFNPLPGEYLLAWKEGNMLARFFDLSMLFQFWPVPNILVLHLGGNYIG